MVTEPSLEKDDVWFSIDTCFEVPSPVVFGIVDPFAVSVPTDLKVWCEVLCSITLAVPDDACELLPYISAIEVAGNMIIANDDVWGTAVRVKGGEYILVEVEVGIDLGLEIENRAVEE